MQAWWRENCNCETVVVASALEEWGVEEVKAWMVSQLPPGPTLYPKEQITEHPERFFVSEIIRERVYEMYDQEIPYAVQVRPAPPSRTPLQQQPAVYIHRLDRDCVRCYPSVTSCRAPWACWIDTTSRSSTLQRLHPELRIMHQSQEARRQCVLARTRRCGARRCCTRYDPPVPDECLGGIDTAWARAIRSGVVLHHQRDVFQRPASPVGSTVLRKRSRAHSLRCNTQSCTPSEAC